jgi:hypothetical protein
MRDPLCVRMVSIGEKRCKRLTNMATFTVVPLASQRTVGSLQGINAEIEQ